jgi:chemotaxis-related protein WspD
MPTDPTSAFSLQPSAFGASVSDDELPAKVHDCWNTIGVEGNGSCRELVKFIHCRNCSVYSDAGLQLLDRPLPAGYRREWTEHFARVKKLGTPVRTSVLIFRVASEWLALPTTAFQEIAERRAMHSLPHRRGKIVLGLVNVRGELTICISLARALGLEGDTLHEKRSGVIFDRLLIAHWSGGRLAFPVGEVHGIHHFQRDELREPPATVSHSSATFTRGVISWRDRSVGVLDADALFGHINRNLS